MNGLVKSGIAAGIATAALTTTGFAAARADWQDPEVMRPHTYTWLIGYIDGSWDRTGMAAQLVHSYFGSGGPTAIPVEVKNLSDNGGGAALVANGMSTQAACMSLWKAEQAYPTDPVLHAGNPAPDNQAEYLSGCVAGIHWVTGY